MFMRSLLILHFFNINMQIVFHVFLMFYRGDDKLDEVYTMYPGLIAPSWFY